MAVNELKTRIRHKRDTSSNWTTNDPKLLNGEIIIVDTADGRVRTKTGDGNKTYTQLPFDDEAIYSAINNKCDASSSVLAVLKADAWNNGQQSISIDGLSANQNGIASLPQNCSDTEYKAVCAANLSTMAQDTGVLTFVANGEIPKIDIPVLIILLG